MTEFKSEFKPGDVVRCINSLGTSLVNKGEKYTVRAVKYNTKHDCTYIYFSANDSEGDRGMNVNRFELVKPADNPFKVGDKVKLKEWDWAHEILEISGDSIKLKSDSKGDCWWFNITVFNFEKESTMKFDPNKKYRRVDTHEPVRIICTDRKDNFVPYIGLWLNAWGYENVLFLVENDERIEEVPQVDWSKVEVDTLVWVGDTPRYFHRYDAKSARVYLWDMGTTSVTNMTGSTWADIATCSLEKPNA